MISVKICRNSPGRSSKMKNNNIIIKILRRREKLKREVEQSGFDTSSIGDLAFLLLIFFVVTASFILRQGIFFSLPSKETGTIKLKKDQIVEVFPLNEGFRYENEIINRDKLTQVLSGQRVKNKKSVLFIKMKPDVKYDRLIDTLSVARETGLNKVSLKNDFEE